MPEDLRAPVAALLSALVRGDLPDQLTWMENYGPAGAALVPQPSGIWTHVRADAVRRDDGGRHLVLPLWTAEESPSDLSAEVAVGPDGTAEILDVRVL